MEYNNPRYEFVREQHGPHIGIDLLLSPLRLDAQLILTIDVHQCSTHRYGTLEAGTLVLPSS